MIKILKFGADWCTSCRALDAKLRDTRIPMTYIDVDENEELAEKYDIRSIPVLVFEDEEGNEKYRIIGIPKDARQTIIDKYNELRQ